MHTLLPYIDSKTIHSIIRHVHRNPLNSKYSCRDEIDKNTYLMKNSSCNQLRRCNVPPNHRTVCSLVSQQHCHPRAGHDCLWEYGNTSRLIHSQGCNQTQLSQHSWVSHAARENIPHMGFTGHSAKPSHSWVS